MIVQRKKFRDLIENSTCALAPLCLDAMTARLCRALGFPAVYLGGGGLGYSMGVSEALLTLSDVSHATAAITRSCDIPLIVDAGVGFGDAVHMTRTVEELEQAGAAAIEIEDQVAPKRASHHKGIEHLVSISEMVNKIEVACDSKADPDFLIIARTNAAVSEGFESAIERARHYRSAGADVILLFPQSAGDWENAPKLLDCPLASIQTHGRDDPPWEGLRYSIIMDGKTGQVLAFDAMRKYYSAVVAGRLVPTTVEEMASVYYDFPDVIGMERLFDIEAKTTERGAAVNNPKLARKN